jgi:hypothetical protein
MASLAMPKSRFLVPLLLGVAVAVPALAQPPAERPLTRYPPNNPVRCEQTKDLEVAQSHFVIGEKAHENGDYDTAAREFAASYEADCTKHDLLIIISRTHEKASTKDTARHLFEAALALETYLERVKDDAKTKERKDLVASLRRRAQEADAKARASASASASATPTATATTTATADRPARPIYPWIVVGAGGALVVGGAITWGIGNANKPDGCSFSSNTCSFDAYKDAGIEIDSSGKQTNAKYRQAQQDAGNAKGLATAGVVLMTLGAVAAAGGVVWYFAQPEGDQGKTHASGARPRVSPAVGPGFAGVQASGAF